MIPTDYTTKYAPDCSTCKHRAKRHKQKNTDNKKPRKHEYICMVCAKAISEHGCFMHTVSDPNNGRVFGGPERWIQDLPCRKYNKQSGRWYAAEWEPRRNDEGED